MVCEATLIRQALLSPSKHWKHYCLIFKGGCVVGQATNTYNEHAEIRAIKRVKNKRNLTLMSVRVNKEGELKNARPCENCMKHMVENGVHTILFSNDWGQIERERI